MRISEMIEALQNVMEDWGDIHVTFYKTQDSYGPYNHNVEIGYVKYDSITSTAEIGRWV